MGSKKLTGYTKPEKYLRGVKSGKTKKEAKVAAGYSANTSETLIENTELFKKALERDLMELGEVFKEHKKNIVQDSDKKAKNTAIDMYYRLATAYPKESTPLEGDFEIIVRSKSK